MDISEVLKHFNLQNSTTHKVELPNFIQNSYPNIPNLTPSDIKLIKILDSLDIQQDMKDLILRILTLENYKKNILRALDIPLDVDPIGVLQAIIDMKREQIEFNGVNSVKLLFKEGTSTEVMNIITDAIYSYSGVNRRNVLKLMVVNSDGEPLERDAECVLEELSNGCGIIFAKYPDSYIIIKGNLDAKTLRKYKFDFSYMSHIVVDADFACDKDTKCFPYQVNGTFDCHGLGKDYIKPNTILPITTKINCAFSITDFDVLMDILPQDLNTLIVEPKLISKKFLSDPEHLAKTFDFIEKYQNLDVIDTKGKHLLDIITNLTKNSEEKELNPKTSQQKSTTVEQIFEPKIVGKHMDVKDILKHCREKCGNIYNQFSDDALERLIRGVLSNQRKNGIQKTMLRRDDGAVVSCIDASQIDPVCQDILKLATEREKTEKNEEQNVSKTQEISVKPTVQPRKIIKAKKPIQIKKYISRDLLKNITKSSQQNVTSVLNAVKEINLDPLDMKFQGPVHIIKDNKITLSATIKKENGCCLVQSIDSSNHTDSKRIVWGVADGPKGLIIVCIGFCEHHNTKRASNIYTDLRNQASKKRTYTKEDLDKYLDIDEIINCNYSNTSNQDYGTELPALNNNTLTQKMSQILQIKR